MTRQFWVLIHRYAGLYMAFFLIVAGLTGSILAFRGEIERWLSPENYDEYYSIPIHAKPVLDPFELRERVMALEPGAQCNSVPPHIEPGKVFTLACEIVTHKGKDETTEYRNISLNPCTGERIPINLPSSFNEPSLWPVTRKNIMACILLLHYELLLGDVGLKIFGIAALIWTLDCFVGFYLTLPIRHSKSAFAKIKGNSQQSPFALSLSKGYWRKLISRCPVLRQAQHERCNGTALQSVSRGFWQRWQVAWKVKWPSSTPRLNFDLHRAGGLWFWPFLFIFAWSSVMFNLRDEVYNPVMSLLFEVSEDDPYPNLPQPLYHPPIDFRDAYAIGKRLMAEQAHRKGFTVLKDLTLEYDPAKGHYSYLVHSDRDLSEITTVTTLWLDATSGAFKGLKLSTGEKSGDTITAWLVSLHLVTVWGLPYRIFVCVLGLVVAMLSVTGVYIWWKKRCARKPRLV